MEAISLAARVRVSRKVSFSRPGTGTTSQTSATGVPSLANLTDLVYSVARPYRQKSKFAMEDPSAGTLRKLVDILRGAATSV